MFFLLGFIFSFKVESHQHSHILIGVNLTLIYFIKFRKVRLLIALSHAAKNFFVRRCSGPNSFRWLRERRTPCQLEATHIQPLARLFLRRSYRFSMAPLTSPSEVNSSPSTQLILAKSLAARIRSLPMHVYTPFFSLHHTLPECEI